uniref:Conotoxin Bn5a n=1 Tax=Conus bandanus TaxID=72279 RepID=CT5A_CONBN|nr:RecName: Full=Conotoxin Bn5a; AltName: Full=Bn5.1 [Conus bandanus]
NGCCIVRECC